MMETRLLAQQKASPPPSLKLHGAVLQRKCACGGSAGVAGECEECSQKQFKVQRATRNLEPETRNSGAVPPIVHDVLRSSGKPLDADTRSFMEPRFGHDFSRVRVHTDALAGESAHAVDALAYTVGRDVVFAPGQYAPLTTRGQRLLAHELAHTVQQVGLPDRPMASSNGGVSSPSDPSEQEADRIADQVMSGQSNGLTHSTALADPNLLHRSIDYDECTSAEEPVVLDSHNRAINMVQNAVTKLATYNGTTPVDTKNALDTHFHSSGTGLAAWIAINLEWLKGQSDSPTYECEKPQVGSRLGWSMWCVPFTDIELYPLWFAESDIDVRARTMIHEWVHRYGCNFDLGYEWEQGYSGHGTLRALLNADSWAHFVYDVR